MASEHTMSLKATLDTSDVQQKLNQVDQKANSVGNVASTSNDLNKLGNSLRNLKQAIGGGAMVHAVGDLTKQLQLFGDSTDSAVQQITKGFNTIFAAMSSGNPIIIATVAAMEGFSTVSSLFKKSLDDMVKASQDALQNLQERVKKANQFRENLGEWEAQQEEEALLESGDEYALRKRYFEQQIRRSHIADELAYERQRAGTIGWDSEAANKLIEEDKNLAASMGKIHDILQKNALARQATEQAVFNEAAEKRDKKESEERSYMDFLIELQQQASKLEEQLAEGYSAPTKITNTSEYTQLLSLFGGGAMSGFSAAGFGMGEVSVTTTISRQIDQVIRLLQDQLRKQLTVVNTSDNTI